MFVYLPLSLLGALVASAAAPANVTNVAINELAAVVGVNGTLAAGISSDNPECAGKDVENDSRWRSDTLSEIKCFSGPPRKKGFSVHRLWTVVLPNDHIFDEGHLGRRDKCGTSVWDALKRRSKPTFPGFTGGVECHLDERNTATLQFQTTRSRQKIGDFDTAVDVQDAIAGATCGYFKDVQCEKRR